MKSILIIGLGRFGRHLCCKFMSLKNEVMIVDRDEAAVTALADEETSAQIADCTDENALRALGVPVETGVFGAHMQVSLLNNGPVTILLDTDIWKKDGAACR